MNDTGRNRLERTQTTQGAQGGEYSRRLAEQQAKEDQANSYLNNEEREMFLRTREMLHHRFTTKDVTIINLVQTIAKMIQDGKNNENIQSFLNEQRNTPEYKTWVGKSDYRDGLAEEQQAHRDDPIQWSQGSSSTGGYFRTESGFFAKKE